MRRSLAGLLFGLAYACAALAISGFLLQRTAFDPDNSSGTAKAVMADKELRADIVDFIVNNVSGAVVDPAAANPPREIELLRRQIAKVASGWYAGGPALFEQIIHDSHARLIGDRDKPVEITGAMLVPIVRNEAVAGVQTLVLPVPEVHVLSLINHLLDWLVPILAVLALAFGVVAVTSHPERDTLFRSLALGLLALAVLNAIVAYLVPKFVLPLVNKSVWAHIPALMADDGLPLLIGVDLVLVGGALGLLAFSGLIRRRRRWSQPISTYRYAEDRRWS